MIMTPAQQIVHSCMMGGSPNYAAKFIGNPVSGQNPPMAPEFSVLNGVGGIQPPLPFGNDPLPPIFDPMPMGY